MMKTDLIVIDPSTGGGIRQGSIYLSHYLSKWYKVLYLSLRQANPVTLFNYLIDIIKEHNPRIIIIHDSSTIEYLSYIKILYPKIIICYFALSGYGETSHTNHIAPFDYVICPYGIDTYNVSTNGYSNIKKVEFMFDLPSRFKIKNPFQSRKKDLIYVGRVHSSKLTFEFLKILQDETDLELHAYGMIHRDNDNYFERLCRLKSFKYFKEIPNTFIHEIYNNYKYFILSSNTDCFSIASIEAIYCGCLPIIKNRYPIGKTIRWPWMPRELEWFRNEEDMIEYIRSLLLRPIKFVDDYRLFIYEKTKERIKQISNIEIFDNILNSEPPNINFGTDNNKLALSEKLRIFGKV